MVKTCKNDVEQHFDEIAHLYDSFKRKNGIYYSVLKRIIRSKAGNKKNVLDYGCGTGQILAYLDPIMGTGFDISSEMVKLAARKFPNFRFTAKKSEIKDKFNTVIMADVVEHTMDLRGDLDWIKSHLEADGRLIVTFVGPFWEPLLIVWEKMGWKMPEGPHQRVDMPKIVNQARSVGLALVEKNPTWFPITRLVFKRI